MKCVHSSLPPAERISFSFHHDWYKMTVLCSWRDAEMVQIHSNSLLWRSWMGASWVVWGLGKKFARYRWMKNIHSESCLIDWKNASSTINFFLFLWHLRRRCRYWSWKCVNKNIPKMILSQCVCLAHRSKLIGTSAMRRSWRKIIFKKSDTALTHVAPGAVKITKKFK